MAPGMQAHALWRTFVGVEGEKLTRLHAVVFYQGLDHHHILGWAPSRDRKPPCYTTFVEVPPPPAHAPSGTEVPPCLAVRRAPARFWPGI